jgi:hypothetical protein
VCSSATENLDTASIVNETNARVNAAMLAMLKTASEPIDTDLQTVCDILLAQVRHEWPI